MKQIIIRVGSGGLIALAGAYVWAVFSLLSEARFPGVILLAIYATVMTCWITFPIGMFLGLIVPPMAEDSGHLAAFLKGTVAGLIAGCVAALAVGLFVVLIDTEAALTHARWVPEAIRKTVGHYLPTMVPHSAAWVGAWTCLQSFRKAVH
jgi:hypothetical protein